MRRIVGDLFDPDEVAVIEGDAEVSKALLQLRFDHVFFTGSTRIGREVMRACAEHLTPVTLELGGKSPAVVDESADLDEAAKKIAWGKALNCGQVCIAPDYVLIDAKLKERFIGRFQHHLEAMHGSIESIGESESYGRIVNRSHAERLERVLHEAEASGGKHHLERAHDVESRLLSPALISDVPPDTLLMQQEIFGPILPIVTFETIDDAVRYVAERDKPLALYLFSRNSSNVERVLEETSSGAVLVNDTLAHFYQLNLPFGGIGASGMGKAHGFYGFETFSNRKAVLRQLTRFSPVKLLYPPYTKFRKFVIDFMLRWL
jgi:aldehyde dehydrogenase (NAD+)